MRPEIACVCFAKVRLKNLEKVENGAAAGNLRLGLKMCIKVNTLNYLKNKLAYELDILQWNMEIVNFLVIGRWFTIALVYYRHITMTIEW